MKKITTLFSLWCFVVVAFAEADIEVQGHLQVTTQIKNHPILQLMKLKISPQGYTALEHRLQHFAYPGKKMVQAAPSYYPRNYELGMANVPVLDQGYQNSCVTFAVTAAIDATLNKGDYISQLCLLSLSEYLSKHSQLYSAWHGAYVNDIFSIISIFGVVNKTQEAEHGCGGLNSYPLFPHDQTPEMSIDEFHQISESIDQLGPVSISNFLNLTEISDNTLNFQKLLMNTKEALYHGNRLIIALLMIPDEHVGAYGKNKLANDTWVLSDSIIEKFDQDNSAIGGHAMIITGYDDDAQVVDEKGVIHQGVFTLRNSWGNKAGDHGNYYVSYDYFEALVMDLTKIKSL